MERLKNEVEECVRARLPWLSGGLYNISSPLDPMSMDPERRWVASRMVPFSARMVVERLACDAREPTRRVATKASRTSS